jgi:FixJ family two-component response regulator
MAESTSQVVAIIDDDPRVRVSVADSLQSAGFAVLTFTSGEEFFRSGNREPVCLIADIHMPGMTGLQLLAKLRHEHRDLPINGEIVFR